MREFQDKDRRRRYLYSPVILLLFSILVFFVAKGASGVMRKERGASARVEELENESQNLEARQKKLENNIAKLKTEEGVVDEIRQKFNVTREGENLAIIIDADKNTGEKQKQTPWYERVWDAMIRIIKK